MFHFFLLLWISPLWRPDTPRDFFLFFVATFQNMIKLYIGNLSPSVTVEDLKQLFRERNLPVPEQVLLKSGYAFVDFPDQNSAIKAIETLSGKCGFDKWCCWWQGNNSRRVKLRESAVKTIAQRDQNVLITDCVYLFSSSSCFKKFCLLLCSGQCLRSHPCAIRV